MPHRNRRRRKGAARISSEPPRRAFLADPYPPPQQGLRHLHPFVRAWIAGQILSHLLAGGRVDYHETGWHSDDLHGHLLGGPRPPGRFDGVKRWELPPLSPEATATYARLREQYDAAIVDDPIGAPRIPVSPELRQQLMDWYRTAK